MILPPLVFPEVVFHKISIFFQISFSEIAFLFLIRNKVTSTSSKSSSWNVEALTQVVEKIRPAEILVKKSTVDQELDCYISRTINHSSEDVNVLSYWESHRDSMPHLASLARKIFHIPLNIATSYSSCSEGRDLIEGSTLLDSDRAEEIIFCKENFFALEPFIFSWKLDEKEFRSHSDKPRLSLSEETKDPGDCHI